MDQIESLATPTTCMGSDDGKLPQTHQRKWKAFRNGRRPVHHLSQQREQLLTGKGFTSVSVRILPSPHHPTKKRPAAAQGRSLLKRAIHKIGKRRKRTPTPPAPTIDTEPPKVKCSKRGEESPLDNSIAGTCEVRFECKHFSIPTSYQVPGTNYSYLVYRYQV